MNRKSILGIIEGQNHVTVTKVHQVQIFKSVILNSYAQNIKHFGYHGRLISGQGHQKSSHPNFQKGYVYSPMHRKGILDIT